MFKRAFVASRVAVLALPLTADGEKKVEDNKSAAGPLQPQMPPEGGWDTARGTPAENAAALCTDTAVGAGVDKKRLDGQVTTVTGEMIDLAGGLELGKRGEKHKNCGQKRLAARQPMDLLTKAGGIYISVEEEHHPRRGSLTEFLEAGHFGHVMEVTATGGGGPTYVQGFVKT
jgi:hypothetical protein